MNITPHRYLSIYQSIFPTFSTASSAMRVWTRFHFVLVGFILQNSGHIYMWDFSRRLMTSSAHPFRSIPNNQLQIKRCLCLPSIHHFLFTFEVYTHWWVGSDTRSNWWVGFKIYIRSNTRSNWWVGDTHCAWITCVRSARAHTGCMHNWTYMERCLLGCSDTGIFELAVVS